MENPGTDWRQPAQSLCRSIRKNNWVTHFIHILCHGIKKASNHWIEIFVYSRYWCQGFLANHSWCVPHINDALFVAKHQISEEPGLVHVSQFDHVVHALHWCRVHDLERGFLLRRQPVFLVGKSNGQVITWSGSFSRWLKAVRNLCIVLSVFQNPYICYFGL